MIVNANKLSKYFEINITINGLTIDTDWLTEEEFEENLFDVLTGFYDGYYLLSRVNKEKLLSSDVFSALIGDHDEFFRQGEY